MVACEPGDSGDGTPELSEEGPTLNEETPENTNPETPSLPSDTGSTNTNPDETPATPSYITIELKGTSYSVSKSGVVTVSGNVLSIVAPGTYRIFGTLDNAQIRVNVEKTEKVELIFAGVTISNSTSAPIYIESADKVSIELEKDTQNVLSDAKTYIFPDGSDKPNACIYSSEDLTIKGEGTLTVNANYNNGIGTKNDLKIKSGNITVNAANNALKGNQSVKIEGGNITLAGADGIKSDSLVEGEGTIQILGGTVNIKAGDDGIQAVTDITITENATVTVNAADKDVNSDGTTNIAEGALISK
jgi:hypothetical protein